MKSNPSAWFPSNGAGLSPLQLALILSLLVFLCPALLAAVTVTEATGGQNIPADKALNSTNGAGYTTLGNIVIAETVNTDFANGTNVTLILTPPDGWQFNPGVGNVSYTSRRNISAASITVAADSVTVQFTVSGTPALDTLTIGNLQVQAFDGLIDPYAYTLVTRASWNPGTAVIAGIEEDGTSFGQLYEVAGAARALTLQTQPSSAASAGVIFDQQPVLNVLDQFGNLRDLDGSTVVTASRGSGAGTLQGTLTCTAAFGTVSYTNLSHNVMGTLTIQFASSNVLGVTSSPIVVGPGIANSLAFSTQPGQAAMGFPFAIQPALKSRDQFGNDSTVGLAPSQIVSVALTSGTGPLLGTTSLDIGTGAGNGTVNFNDLQIDAVGSNKQLTASAAGFTNATSSNFKVTGGAFSKLQLLLPGETAAPGTPTGKTGTPAAQTAGAAFTVTVNAVDNDWNVIDTVSDTVDVAASDPNALLPADTALVNGTKSFSVSLKTAGTATLTASDMSNPARTNNTSPALLVKAGALARMQLLVPGETAAPGSASGKIGTPTAQIAGNAFSGTVNAVDANWNVVPTNDVVGITSSDGNAALPGSAALVAGTQTFSVTLKTAGSRTLTASDITHSAITASTSPSITLNAGAFAMLQILAPGETALPGGATGKTGTPAAQIAGNAFNVTVNAVDANWNLVTSAADTVGLSSSDANAILPANAALANGTRTFSATLRAAGSATLTASDLIDNSKTANTSPAITVNPGVFSKLQILAPGEAAAPGSATGKTGSPALETAGAAFNVTVNAVDANWNPLTNVTHTVGITSSDSKAVLPTNAVLVAGTKNFSVTLKTAPAQSVTASDITDGTKSANTSPGIAVSAAAAVRLSLQTQPSSTATAGVAFGQQPVVRIEDVFGNLRTADNSTVVTAARAAGSGTLQGSVSQAAVAGLVSFTDLAHTVATNITIQFTSGSLTNVSSGTIAVGAAAAARLTVQKQPSPVAVAGGAFTNQPVIRIEDAFGNLVNSDNSTIVTAARSAGTGTLQGATSRTASSGVVSFTNLSYTVAETITVGFAGGSLTGAVSGSIVVNPAAASRLTLQTQPALTATAGVVFAPQPVLRIEDAYGNLRSGDTTVVTATRLAGSGNLQGATNVAAIGGVITFANLAHNVATNITIQFSGGALTGATSSAIAVSPAAASRLTVATQPSATATAGVAFAQQPVVRIEDPFGNLVGSDNSTTVTAARGAGSGALQGTTSVVAANGRVNFTDLAHTVATNITIVFSSGSLAGATTTPVAVSPAAAASVVFVQSPADALAGTVINPPVTVQLRDSFGNSVPGVPVSLALGTGTGTLSGTTTRTTDANGLATFNDLSVNLAGTKQLAATAGSLGAGVSAPFAITPAAASRLAIQTQPPGTATAGLAFAQQPVIQIQDQFGNLRTNDNTTIVSAARAAGSGTLQGTLTATAVNGIATFTSLAHNVATNITIQFTGGSLTSVTSSGIAISPAAANRLTIQTQPSPAATTGVPFAQQPVIRIEDAYGNLVASDNSSVVTATRNAGSGTLQGAASVIASGGRATFTNLSHTVATTITIDFNSGSLSGTTSGNIVVSPGPFSRLLLLAPGETAAPGTPSGKTGAPAVQTAGTAYLVNVRAVDANWNLVNPSRQTVGITCSDPNDVLPANKSLVNGSNSFSLINKTAGNWTVTATDITDATKTTGTAVVRVNSGAFAKLQLIVPGETASPGSSSGKTGSPVAQAAGTTFNLTVNAVDANWNLVNSPTDSVGISTTDPNDSHPASAPLVAGSQTFGVAFKTAGSWMISAVDLSDGSKASNSSPSIVVSSGAFTKLQLLVPGESAAPGTATGKTGAPTARTSGTAFSVTANAVDANWNLVKTATEIVGITSGDASATLPANTALVAGTKALNVTLRTAGTQSVTASDITDGTRTAYSNPTIPVAASSPARLTIVTQPSSSATAGNAFAQQPAVRVEDAAGNLVATNGFVVTASRGTGTAALQGKLTATTVGGIATFTNLSYNLAETITVNFSATGLTPATSGNVVVNVGPFAKLQLLVPGETAAPGTASGKTGTPVAQTANTPFTVTVNAVDAGWNFINGRTDTVGLTSSDATALLPQDTALVSGTKSFTVFFGTNGTFTLTASDIFDGSKPASTSPLITVAPVPFTPAAGGRSISADTVGGSWTTLTGPVYAEKAVGNVSISGTTTKTISLKAPGGFEFDTGGSPVTDVLVTGDTNPGRNINGVGSGSTIPVSRTATALTISITASSSGKTPNTLTWRNVRVRPTSGTPLALSNLTLTLTNVAMAGVTSGSNNFGVLREIAGAANRLSIQMQPSAIATVGVPFDPQPILLVQDQYGNLRNSANGNADNTTVVTAGRSAGSGTLQGTLAAASLGGVATFTNLSHDTATNITILFTSGSLTNVTSSTVVVSPPAVPQLAKLAQPANASAVPSATIATIVSTANPAPTGSNITFLTGLSMNTNGVTLTIKGLPGYTYRVERRSTVDGSDSAWQSLGTATMDNNGNAVFTDTTAPRGAVFYRMVWP